MKIKELIKLNNTDLLRLYMENQGIKNLTDKELDAAYGVCEGHGYELFTTNLENGLLYKVDEHIIIDDELDLQDDHNYSCETPDSFLDLMLEYLGELCNDSYSNRDEFEEEERDQWKSYFETYNILLDFNSKIKESYKKYRYTAEATILVHDIEELKTSKEVFNSEIDCYKSVYKLINDFINLPREGEIKDLTNRYNLSDKSELERFLLEIREHRTISLLWDNTYLNIKVKTEVIPEVYYVSLDAVKYGVYEHHQELHHFDSKVKAIRKFNELVKPYKEKYPEDKIGEYDSLYESNCEDIMFYELFIDDILNVECALGLVEIK